MRRCEEKLIARFSNTSLGFLRESCIRIRELSSIFISMCTCVCGRCAMLLRVPVPDEEAMFQKHTMSGQTKQEEMSKHVSVAGPLQTEEEAIGFFGRPFTSAHCISPSFLLYSAGFSNAEIFQQIAHIVLICFVETYLAIDYSSFVHSTNLNSLMCIGSRVQMII